MQTTDWHNSSSIQNLHATETFVICTTLQTRALSKVCPEAYEDGGSAGGQAEARPRVARTALLPAGAPRRLARYAKTTNAVGGWRCLLCHNFFLCAGVIRHLAEREFYPIRNLACASVWWLQHSAASDGYKWALVHVMPIKDTEWVRQKAAPTPHDSGASMGEGVLGMTRCAHSTRFVRRGRTGWRRCRRGSGRSASRARRCSSWRQRERRERGRVARVGAADGSDAGARWLRRN
eukprot:2294947-Pleurochrysis_carterae.AAC.4